MGPLRRPLSNTVDQPPPNLIEIFNNSQHVTTSDSALNQLKKLHKITEFSSFESQFRECVKKLFQSKQTIYFKTSCEFLCKFLQYLSKLSDESKARGNNAPTLENTAPTKKSTRRSTRSSATLNTSSASAPTSKKRVRPLRKTTKRKASASSDDELVSIIVPSKSTAVCAQDTNESDDELVSMSAPKKRCSVASSIAPVTDYDRIISSVIDVADIYMQVADEECRFNAVFFICKFLSHVESLDEEICDALKSTLPKRIRDRKPMIRAQAVLASRTFQQSKLTQEGFKHHFERDPELVVRKALLQIMDTSVFGFDFIVDSTQDFHAVMRKAAFQRAGKLSPLELSSKHVHQVIRNGLNERDRQASYSFKTHALEPWLSALYDGIDLLKLLESFDILNNYDDIVRLLQLIYERNLEELINNGTTTKLHQVVESFRERWLNCENLCLPSLDKFDEKGLTIWITLFNFCKKNQSIIKPVRIRAIEPQVYDPNESIEKILESQNANNDDMAELYERLMPDLVNLIDFLKRFVHLAAKAVHNKDIATEKLEFIYHEFMNFISVYEIGDELERKTVQEVLGNLLKENLLTGKFANFIPPIVNCLFKLIYSSSSNLMITFISELINNVRSHLEDLSASTRQQPTFTYHSTENTPDITTRSARKARADRNRRNSRRNDQDQQNLEFKIATIRVEIEELKDKFDECIKGKDFDEAKRINNRIEDLKVELTMLHDRRCSIASDVSHMSMVVENEPTCASKFSSTMIGETSISETQASTVNKDEVKIFKHHRNELLKCLQMYLGCLQSVEITNVPQTMLNHLTHLSYESLDEWYKEDTRVRSLMIACNGITALVDKEFALSPTTTTLLLAACFDKDSIEVKAEGFKNLTDVLCQHSEIDFSIDKIEKFLNLSLREYGKYSQRDMKMTELEFDKALVEGTAKLFYYKKLSSAQVLSHLIIWWYHPRTHSKLKQFIGIFLPTFVDDLMKDLTANEKWLSELLEETFVTSVEFLHEYILGAGFNIMAASDIHNLINFLCNLIPVSIHSSILTKVEERIDELPEGREDLLKYLKQAKNSLTATIPSTPIARPLQQVDTSQLL